MDMHGEIVKDGDEIIIFDGDTIVRRIVVDDSTGYDYLALIEDAIRCEIQMSLPFGEESDVRGK